MRRFPHLVQVFLGVLLFCSSAACRPEATDRDWREVARSDVEAAHTALIENHPGAVPELGDQAFMAALQQAWHSAQSEIAKVETRADYIALMQRYADTFSDRHIAFVQTSGAKSPAIARSSKEKRRSNFDFRVQSGQLFIIMPALDEEARNMVKDLKSSSIERSEIASVVIDLRGNGGGDSQIGDEVIVLLFGREGLRRVRVTFRNCPVLWRVSEGNAKWVRDLAMRFEENQPARAGYLNRVSKEMEAALEAGEKFVPQLDSACISPPPIQPKHQSAPTSVPVTVVTDSACFSSCLIFLERLLSLGARQSGEPTAGGNWYMEVRFVDLPSRLGKFSVLQKVDLRRSKSIGPFIPDEAGSENRDQSEQPVNKVTGDWDDPLPVGTDARLRAPALAGSQAVRETPGSSR